MKKHFKILSLLLILVIAGSVKLFAADQIEGLWQDPDGKAKIQIYKGSDNKFHGKLAWLKNEGKKDEKNPIESQRNTPLLGKEILKGFNKDGDKKYVDGTIYDPESGKTYSCKMTYKGNTLDIRGYIGMSLLGRTTTWTRAK